MSHTNISLRVAMLFSCTVYGACTGGWCTFLPSHMDTIAHPCHSDVKRSCWVGQHSCFFLCFACCGQRGSLPLRWSAWRMRRTPSSQPCPAAVADDSNGATGGPLQLLLQPREPAVCLEKADKAWQVRRARAVCNMQYACVRPPTASLPWVLLR